jgi:predicted nucleic acid-binding Zn ribbon protein
VAGKLPAAESRFPAKWTPAVRVIREWRGLPGEPRPDRAAPIGDLLGIILPKLGLDARIKEADIQASWKGIVGEFIAQHSQPDRLVAGTLHIRVMQPSVRYELDRTWKPVIIRKLREQFGEKMVRDIKFVL